MMKFKIFSIMTIALLPLQETQAQVSSGAPQPPPSPQYLTCNAQNMVTCTSTNQGLAAAYQANLNKYQAAYAQYQEYIKGKNSGKSTDGDPEEANLIQAGLQATRLAVDAGTRISGAKPGHSTDDADDSGDDDGSVTAPIESGPGTVYGSTNPSIARLNHPSGDSGDVLKDNRVIKHLKSPKTKILMDYAVKNKIRDGRRNSAGKCNLYVVNAVRAADLPAWTGSNAYYAVEVTDVAVNQLGYINLLSDYTDLTAKNAPIGSILVYSSQSTPSCTIPKGKLKGEGCGHIEIKTDSQYVSDYIDSVPVNEGDSRYKLTAVLIYNDP